MNEEPKNVLITADWWDFPDAKTKLANAVENGLAKLNVKCDIVFDWWDRTSLVKSIKIGLSKLGLNVAECGNDDQMLLFVSREKISDIDLEQIRQFGNQ